MRVVAVFNMKGGVGKSTIAAALAVRASNDGKRRVAIADLDPQRSLSKWSIRREDEQPEVFTGEDDPKEAVERLSHVGYDIAFLDTAPGVDQHGYRDKAVSVADLIIIPCLPSMSDIDSTSDAVAVVREFRKPMLLVINRGSSQALIDAAREFFKVHKVPVARSVLMDRVSHIHGFTVGKTASEVSKGKDAKATEEIDELWREAAKLLGVKP